MINDQFSMINQKIITNDSNKYDLEERTAVFAEKVIDFCKKIPQTIITAPILSQLIRSTTSVGANYCEANSAMSGKDFRNKIGICRKEARETCYWLRILARAIPQQKEECRLLWKEAHELLLIFSAITSKKRHRVDN